jgi:hypothetical protein
MKDPTRFLELRELEPDAATELLRAGALEEPPAGAVERLLGVLSAPAAGSGAVAPVQAHLSGMRPALRAAQSVGGVSAKLGVRWLVLTAGGASLIAAAWLASQSRAPGARSLQAPVALQPMAAPVPSVRPAPPPPSDAPVSAQAEGSAHKERRPRSLAQEIASLDQVRQLLVKGEPSQALAALRRHARTYADGALQQEASLLRIEALLRAGEPAQARALAARFLKEHADSPHQERVRALMTQANASL